MIRKVLYVEDNVDAVIFVKQIVNKIGDYELKVIENGSDILKLTSDINYIKENMPEIILLDINLPGMNGFEILKHIRAQAKFKNIPVIMFTSSESKPDVEQSYACGANAYLVKPSSLESLQVVLKDTFNFWLKHNVA